MAFSVSPNPVEVSGSFTATGTGARKRPTRIRVTPTDSTMPNAILAEFVMPANGRFNRALSAPGGPSRETTLLLQQKRTDGVWAQTAMTKLTLVAQGNGGGTTPEPPNPPPDPDLTAPTLSNVVIGPPTQTSCPISLTTSETATVYVDFGTTTAYGSTITLTAVGNNHSGTMPSLTAGTTYLVRIRAVDTSSNVRVDTGRSFTTVALPPSGGTYRVTSWSAFLNALRDTTKRDITIADGSYTIPWTDINPVLYPGYARTAATSVVIRTDTPGGVTLDLGGSGSPHLWFRNGASYQQWPWIKFANSHPGNNGVIQFGEGNGTPIHHLTFDKIEFLSSITTGPGPNGNYTNGQGLYFSWASGGGNHDIVINEFVSNAELWAPIHIYHDEMDGPGHDISILGGTINCTGSHGQMGIMVGSSEISGYLFQDIDITGANQYGVYLFHTGGTMTFRRVTTTGSGTAGITPSLPVAGVTVDSCSFA